MAIGLLEKLGIRHRETEVKTVRDFVGLVVATADGKPVNVEAAEDVLARAGKSPSDLANAVARLGRRRQLRAIVDSWDSGAAARAKIDGRIGELDKSFQEAKDKYESSLHDLRDERLRAVIAGPQADAARAELLRDMPPELRGRIAVLEAENDQLTAEHGSLGSELQHLDQRIESGTHQVAMEDDGQWSQWVAGARKTRAALAKKIEGLDQQRANVKAKIAKLESECLAS